MGKSKSKSSKSSKSDLPVAPPSIIEQLQPAVADDTASTASSTTSKKEKKDKKKDKKRKSSSSDDAASPSDNSTAAVEEPAKKKAKTESTTTNDVNADGVWEFKELAAVTNMSISDVESYYKEHNMTIEGHEGECFKPLLEFAHAGLPSVVMGALEGFQKPTPIQAASWPIALRNRDLIAIAETGSGKTLGFTIPALIHVRNQLAKAGGKKRPTNAPHVLVVLPTRELAMQVASVTEAAGKACGLKSVCLYGGVPKWEQAKTIAGAHFAVGTPGRLVDLAINDGSLDLSQVSMIVLDEADRMLDLGFEKDIRQLMGAVMDKSKRQTLMFSATWPMGVRKLASEFLVDPVKLTIGDDELAASQTVTQVVEVLKDAQNNPRDKERRLLDLLRKYQGNKKSTKVLVFALYKKEAQRLEDCLRRAGYTVEGIHGDKNQGSRTQALQRFRDGVAPVLVATDVAARGLDIPNVEYVINVTFPLTIEDYVHRIGRTGRAGKKGLAHTLFTSHDKAHSGELVNVLKQANQTVPEDLVKFGTTVKRKEHSAYGAFFKDVDTSAKATLVKFDSDDDE